VAATYTAYTPPAAGPTPTDEAKTVPLEETAILRHSIYYAYTCSSGASRTDLDKFSQPIEDVQGIGPINGQKLREIGIVAHFFYSKPAQAAKDDMKSPRRPAYRRS